MSTPDGTLGLGILCKPPRPGESKTRLARSIGPAAAALMSRALLQDTAAVAAQAADACGLGRTAFFRPPDAEAELSAILGPDWRLVHADCGDLGATMHRALETLLHRHPAGAMIMGADVPLITCDAIAAAAGCLRRVAGHDAVVIPSTDGGYGLIGIRCPARAAPLFAPMGWGTSTVLKETMLRAQHHGLSVALMEPVRDIDEAADLDWLRSELERRPDAGTATRLAMAHIDRVNLL